MPRANWLGPLRSRRTIRLGVGTTRIAKPLNSPGFSELASLSTGDVRLAGFGGFRRLAFGDGVVHFVCQLRTPPIKDCEIACFACTCG